jgi:hypothetical protein
MILLLLTCCVVFAALTVAYIGAKAGWHELKDVHGADAAARGASELGSSNLSDSLLGSATGHGGGGDKAEQELVHERLRSARLEGENEQLSAQVRVEQAQRAQAQSEKEQVQLEKEELAMQLRELVEQQQPPSGRAQRHQKE